VIEKGVFRHGHAPHCAGADEDIFHPGPDVFRRDAQRNGASHGGPHRGTADDVHRDAEIADRPPDADMRHAERAAARQHHADGAPR
jgi:hypothetical protein